MNKQYHSRLSAILTRPCKRLFCMVMSIFVAGSFWLPTTAFAAEKDISDFVAGNASTRIKQTITFSNDMNADTGGALNASYYLLDKPIPAGRITSINYATYYGSGNQHFYLCTKNGDTYSIVKEITDTASSKSINTIPLDYESSTPLYLVTKSNTRFLNGSSTVSQQMLDMTLDGNTFSYKGGYNMPAQAKITVKVEAEQQKPISSILEGRQVVTVSPLGDADYDTINKALSYAYTIESRDNPVAILIKPGVYEEVLFIQGKHNVSLIGTDRDKCIIRDDSGNYNKAPVRIEGDSYVANLTIIATHNDDPTYETRERSSNVFSDTTGSYAIHIDDAHTDDDLDYTCTVQNCVLYSEQNAVVGCGLQKNQTVNLIGCQIVKNLSEQLYNNNVFRRIGAVYCHSLSVNTSNYESFGYQKFNMTGCTVETNVGTALELGTVGTSADVTFIDNDFYSDSRSGNACVYRHKDFVLSPMSRGNNIPSLNNINTDHTPTWDSGVITTEPTCTREGILTYTCYDCEMTNIQTVRPRGHKPVTDPAVEPTCSEYGYTEGSHCSVCGTVLSEQTLIEKKPHSYSTVVNTTAKVSREGKLAEECAVCGDVRSTTPIAKIASLKLSTTTYTYNGKVKRPAVTVKDSKGEVIPSDYYTLTYSAGRTDVGKYQVTVKFKDRYTGTKNLYFRILPKATSINDIDAQKGGFIVKWNKITPQTSGYQVQYSTSSKFASPKTYKITNPAITSKRVTGLESGKKYYVRVRTYKTVDGQRYFSKWSKTKAVIAE